MGYPFSNGDVLSHSDMNAVGLHLITPSGATNGTLSGATVTIGSTVSSVAVAGVFSATFDNYKIVVTNADASVNAELLMLQIGGSTAHNYAGIQMINNSDTQTVKRASNTSGVPMGLTWTNKFSCQVDVMAPFVTTYTTFNHPVYGSAGRTLIVGGSINESASYTGFTIAPASGTLSGGTIRVYGYGEG